MQGIILVVKFWNFAPIMSKYLVCVGRVVSWLDFGVSFLSSFDEHELLD